MRLLSKIINMRFFSYLYINFVRLFRLTDLYQPTYKTGKLYLVKRDSPHRPCEDRISAIIENADFDKVNTYLDAGSQIGYFVFRLNELGNLTMAHGIEMNRVAYNYASALVFLNDKKNVSFTNVKIGSSFVRKMPSYDMISFLNVFHHVVHFDGFEEADRIMKALHEKCNAYFIFETGQFNEKGFYWSGSLAFMGDNPEKWIENYLKDIGYREVRLVNRFDTHLNSGKRAFFICSK